MKNLTRTNWEDWFNELSMNDYVVIDTFLSTEILVQITDNFNRKIKAGVFRKAAVGATGNENIINEIRGDYTYWLEKGKDKELNNLFVVFDEIMYQLNRHCFLSLSDYEFHFAHYPVGSFYKKHLDQFTGRNNRMISLIIYLNENWQPGDGGELCIYPKNKSPKSIAPLLNRCVLFKSDMLEHEVLTAKKPRKSITGWMLYQPGPLVIVSM